SLSAHPKVRQLFAIDASKDALKIARANEKLFQRGLPIEWLNGDLLTPIHQRQIRPDFIVANLPYVRTSEMAELAPELQWEPRMALEGGQDGLRFIAACIDQAAVVLKPGGMLLLEIGSTQSRAVAELFKQSGVWSDTLIFRDLAGLPRIVQSRRKGF